MQKYIHRRVSEMKTDAEITRVQLHLRLDLTYPDEILLKGRNCTHINIPEKNFPREMLQGNGNYNYVGKARG